MSASDEQAETNATQPSFVKWLLLSLAFTAMLAFAAAHLRGQPGIVCRFAPLYGFVVGAAAGWLTGQGRGTHHRTRLIVIAALAAAGFVGITLESRRMYAIEIRHSLSSGPTLIPLPPQIIDETVEARVRFSTYLRHRVSENAAFGQRTSTVPWAATIWAVEILLAAGVAAVACHYFARPQSPDHDHAQSR